MSKKKKIEEEDENSLILMKNYYHSFGSNIFFNITLILAFIKILCMCEIYALTVLKTKS